MQERLQKSGMRPINNVVDITNYVMLETGQPLHAFDYDLVRGKRIVARRAKQGEKLVTLDGIEREFDSEMLLICDGEGPVGIAGVMGGGNSEVSDKTKTVLLEIANFKPGNIRRTSTQLKLRTEASLRFEKGLGMEMPEYAQHRALHLFEQLTGGTVASGLVDVYPGKAERPTVKVTASRIEQVLGISVPRAEVERILGDLGFECSFSAPDTYAVLPPDWRPDVVDRRRRCRRHRPDLRLRQAADDNASRRVAGAGVRANPRTSRATARPGSFDGVPGDDQLHTHGPRTTSPDGPGNGPTAKRTAWRW